MHEYGVFIGRFQPFHNAHLEAVRFALSRVERLIIVLGSACSARTVKNPWTSSERKEMILGAVTAGEWKRIHVVDAKDYLYNDNLWLTAVQQKIERITGDSDDIILFGHRKDPSSFYLKLFPQWRFVELGNIYGINGTDIRNFVFLGAYDQVKNSVPAKTYDMCFSSHIEMLKQEFNFIMDYRRLWEAAPHPPMFITTDAVVIRSGHVLVVRRKGHPGKGLVALPGGFLKQDERIIDGCIRELKEETGIKLPKTELKKMIVDEKVFDYPERSLRGRTVTHAFCIDLGHGELPKVKGSDDADKAWWMPLRDLDEDAFFEDHFHIVNFFVSRF